MRACMVAYTFYETDNRVRRYAETLVRRGDHVDAIVLRREGQSSFEMISGVHVHRIQKRVIDERGPLSYLMKLLTFLLLSAWELTRRHIKTRYDVIHVHSVPDFEVFAALIPRLMGAKVILDIHDIVPELYASKFKIGQDSFAFRMLVWMERLSGRFANHVIVANHIWHQRLVERSIPAERCTPILNYPDPNIFQRRESAVENRGEFLLCYPGTLSWHQGVDLIINAMGRLRDKAPNVRLLIVGDGAERERLAALARDRGIEDRVKIKSGIPIDEVARTMVTVDLGVEPKRKQSFANEALSTKIPEFMAVGVPVVASDTLVHRYYFSSDLVEFFESDNDEQLAAKIMALVKDPEKLLTLRERGLEFIAKNNWDVKKGEYLGLLDRLVASKSGSCRVEDVA